MTETVQVESPVAESSYSSALNRKPAPITRLVSLDAFRGLVMILMLGELMRLPEVAARFRTAPCGQ